MPDWTGYVQQKLGSTGLPRHCEQEIVAELACHLEDIGDCVSKADAQVHDWRAFARDIRKAKEDYMHGRVRTFWVPGLAVDLLATFLLRGIQVAGVHPTVFLTQPIAMVIYPYWLLMLPLVGALGAYWSQHAGGRPVTRMLVATFPCVVLGTAMIFFSIASMVAALFVPQAVSGVKFLAIATAETLFVWVVMPGVALGLGALPFLTGERRPEPAHSDAAAAAR